MIRWMRLAGAILILSAVQVVFAALPANDNDRATYLELLRDLYSEVLTMDAVVESKEDRERFIAEFQRAILDPSYANPALEMGKSWSGIWPPPPLTLVDVKKPLKNYVSIRAKSASSTDHSLHDLNTYVHQRLGEKTSRALVEGKVVGFVYGGRPSSALAYLGVQPDKAIRIPSFYESWGITKVYAPSESFVDGKPRLIIVVPPSTQYLQHYATMMRTIDAKYDRVILDRADQISYRLQLQSSLLDITRTLQAKPDYIVLGYYNQWVSVVGSLDSDWRLLNTSEEAKGAIGLTGRVLTLMHKTTGEISNVLLVASALTMWGEAAAFIAEGALKLKPKGLIFMGSSGAVSSLNEVYGLSVPEMFLTKKGRQHVGNFVQRGDRQMQTMINDTEVRFGARHANTFSPIEQDRSYLTKLRQLTVDTVDVEQSLIAEAIVKHNSGSSKVLFGAINLITDKPGSIFENIPAAHDLDRVDWNKKERARQAAVQLALESIGRVESRARVSCRMAFGGN